MATFKSFEEIDVWQKARVLAKLVYAETSKPKFDNDRKLRSQMSGSSGSIMDNIAEGQGRGGSREFRQFLWIAKGSSAELRSQLYRSFDREYLDKQTFEDLFNKADEIEKMLKGLINHIEKSELKGIKYKTGEL
ncbi:MAG TPA: four helix bundle protein [Bacteroidales bacterium]